MVGGGVAGLVAAWRLRELGAEVTLLERELRVGGLIETEHRNGFTFEHGPDGFLGSRGDVLTEISNLQLDDELVTNGPAPRRAFVATLNGLAPLPAGIFRFERSSIFGLLRSPLLSRAAKVRLFLEPFAKSATGDDEDVESFFARRLGTDVARHIVDPMLRGIYGAPGRDLGIRATMPKLAGMERRFGSLGLALIAARRSPPGVGLVTLRRGMASLVDRIASKLGSTLHLGVEVTELKPTSSGVSVKAGRLGTLHADSVVLACPAWVTAGLLGEIDAELGDQLSGIRHSRADTIGLAYAREQIPVELDGTGFVVDADRAGMMVACTWASRKWPDRAPDGAVLLRCVAQAPDANDAELVDAIRCELRQLMGIRAEPRMVRVRRRARALPTYGLHHARRVGEIRDRARALGRIELAGNAYDGVGVPDCIASGRQAALALARVPNHAFGLTPHDRRDERGRDSAPR